MENKINYPYLIPPRGYQRDTYPFIYRIKRALLAYEMGTGKTKIALDFIGALLFHKKIAQALVVAPLRVLDVWESEIEKNWPQGLTYFVLRPDTEDKPWKNSQLILTNYDFMRTRTTELMQWGADVIVLDESHKIKNPYAKQAKAAHKLGNTCRFAICLSGTPIGNHPLDRALPKNRNRDVILIVR